MPSTAWKESIPEGETERFARYAGELRDLQRAHAGASGVARALHAKMHAGARAELEIFADLPEHARHGLFAAPRTYAAYVRYSNGNGKRQHDKAADVRGVAVKVLGVAGKKALSGADEPRTQDLLAIQSPATPFRTADEFVAFVRAADSPALLPVRLVGAIGFGRALAVLRRLASSAGAPVASLAGITFYSALPVRVGPYAARYAFAPLQAQDARPPAERGPGYLARDLAARLREGPVAYELRLQFFEDERRTPIEDASVDWDSPYVAVGRLTLPTQDLASAEGEALAARIDAMSFDPWHALVEHTPLGGMMRARKEAYFASTKERAAAGEPDGA